MVENVRVLSNLELVPICYTFYGISHVANVTKLVVDISFFLSFISRQR